MLPIDFAPWLLPVLIILALAFSAIRILREYERGVIFTLGQKPKLVLSVRFSLAGFAKQTGSQLLRACAVKSTDN